MTQKKKRTEKYGKRTIMIPPEINKRIDKLPEGTRSAWIEDAIKLKLTAQGGM
jgi:predicted transcriptional regulator